EREIDEVLAFIYGSMPVFTCTYQAAMRLAEFCHPRPRQGEGAFPEPRGVPPVYAGSFRHRAGFSGVELEPEGVAVLCSTSNSGRRWYPQVLARSGLTSYRCIR